MKIKAQRTIVGLIARVRLSCGCYALVSKGKAVIEKHYTKHLTVHVCPLWKRHKYDLASAERDLAKRLRGVKWPTISLN